MILSLVNQKGGVAKTTSTFNIATCLAQKAKKGMYDGKSSVEFAPSSELAKEYNRICDIILELN